MGSERKRIVILGGGFGGAYAAQALIARDRGRRFDVTLVDIHNYVLYYPLLIEAAVGTIEPRHVVVPTRKFLGRQGSFLMGEIESVDFADKVVRVAPDGARFHRDVPYDELVVALGSVTKPSGIEGLAEHGFGIKSLGEGIGLRDRGIGLLEQANAATSDQERKAALTVIVVGANYTGVEFAGEYHAFLRSAGKSYPNVRIDDIRVLLLEYSDRVLGMFNDRAAAYAVRELTRRGVEVKTNCSVSDVGVDCARLTTGESVATRTVVWTAGIAPNPLLAQLGLPLNDKGYIVCERDMRVKGIDDIWAIGDAAAIPDANGNPYPATAQHSSRQGVQLAKNLALKDLGRASAPFDYKTLGSFAAIGNHRAAAEVLGLPITGLLGWFVYRTAYLVKFPTFRMKLRLALDWFVDIIVPYPPAQLGLSRARSGRE